MSSSIVPAGSFAALTKSTEGPSFDEIVRTNMGPGGIDPSMLDRVKVPAGGATTWEVPGLGDEPDSKKELVGVIVGIRNIRSFYEDAYDGGNEPPDCSSDDSVTGTPRVDDDGNLTATVPCGGSCYECEQSRWGSGKNGGQACSQRMLIMLLQPDSILPIVVNAPPTSLKEIVKLLQRLTSRGVLFHSVVVSLKLTKETNAGGVPYSRIAPSFVRDLDNDEAMSAAAMFRGLNKVFTEIADQPF